jgi:hypothetical protein
MIIQIAIGIVLTALILNFSSSILSSKNKVLHRSVELLPQSSQTAYLSLKLVACINGETLARQ